MYREGGGKGEGEVAFSGSLMGTGMRWQGGSGGGVHAFPRAAVTKDHKWDASKQHESVLSLFWRPDPYSQKVAELVPPGGPGEKPGPSPGSWCRQ